MNKQHHHLCSDCQTKTPCRGEIRQDYGASPEYFCVECDETGHHAETEEPFICEGCQFRRDDAEAAAAMPEAER